TRRSATAQASARGAGAKSPGAARARPHLTPRAPQIAALLRGHRVDAVPAVAGGRRLEVPGAGDERAARPVLRVEREADLERRDRLLEALSPVICKRACKPRAELRPGRSERALLRKHLEDAHRL